MSDTIAGLLRGIEVAVSRAAGEIAACEESYCVPDSDHRAAIDRVNKAARALAVGARVAMRGKETRKMSDPKGTGTTGFVARELERVGVALQGATDPKLYAELYAVQQALIWATDPNNFASPMDAIKKRKIAK